ncbi:MAG: MbnP family protein [Bacteroidota bacterium]
MHRLLLLLTLLPLGLAAQPASTGQVLIEVRAFWGKTPLSTGRSFVSSDGDTLTVQKWKWYFRTLQLHNAQGTVDPGLPPRLIDLAERRSGQIRWDGVPAGTYRELNFGVGMDSAQNTAPEFTGDLDPVNGMYWTWNTGFIQAKFEGRLGHRPGQKFEFHIGGYRAPYGTSREVRLHLAKKNAVTVEAGKLTRLILQVDLRAAFRKYIRTKASEPMMVMSPGENAARIADRFPAMFRLVPYPKAK